MQGKLPQRPARWCAGFRCSSVNCRLASGKAPVRASSMLAQALRAARMRKECPSRGDQPCQVQRRCAGADCRTRIRSICDVTSLCLVADTRQAVLCRGIVAVAAIAIAPARAATCTAKSGPQSVPLVELYTSEGCSSCPPADRWLSATFAKSAPRASGIALAFHVDYWDRLGWKDRFATPAFTQRQYDSMRGERRSLRLHAAGHRPGKGFSAMAGGRARSPP